MEKEKESTNKKILVKIYLAVLFVAGIVMGFSFIAARNNAVISMEQAIDNALVLALTENGIEQQDVLSQYVEENKTGGILYHKYFKKIKFKNNIKIETLEQLLKNIAEEHKVELSRTTSGKSGNIKYEFYDRKRTVSIVEFVHYKPKPKTNTKKRRR